MCSGPAPACLLLCSSISALADVVLLKVDTLAALICRGGHPACGGPAPVSLQGKQKPHAALPVASSALRCASLHCAALCGMLWAGLNQL